MFWERSFVVPHYIGGLLVPPTVCQVIIRPLCYHTCLWELMEQAGLVFLSINETYSCNPHPCHAIGLILALFSLGFNFSCFSGFTWCKFNGLISHRLSVFSGRWVHDYSLLILLLVSQLHACVQEATANNCSIHSFGAQDDKWPQRNGKCWQVAGDKKMIAMEKTTTSFWERTEFIKFQILQKSLSC